MNCPYCGAQMASNKKFCTSCGKELSQQRADLQPSETWKDLSEERESSEGFPQKSSNKKKKIFIIVGAVLLLLLIAGGTWWFLIQRKYAKYDEALMLMKDSKYEEAARLFSNVGDFKDAPSKVKFCQDSLSFEKAEKLLEEKKYEEAKKLFFELGDFKGALEKVKFCDLALDFELAESLLADQKYEEAKKIYEALPEGSFPRLWARIHLCEQKIQYLKAEEQLASGSYYEAYKSFSLLKNFEDAEDRMKECVQPFPETGEVYRNPDISNNALVLYIETPLHDPNRSYLKIYTLDEVLVSCVAIEQYASIAIDLPVGSYRIQVAYGKEWFGEEKLFGDEGFYSVLMNNTYGGDIFSFSEGFQYTLTLNKK